MDPDECLKQIREVCKVMQVEGTFTGNYLNASAQLLELVESIDTWMSDGGFLPIQWQRLKQQNATFGKYGDPAVARLI